MSFYDRALIWAVVALIVLILIGLGNRRRLAACVSWTLYLLAVAASDTLIAGDPGRFYRQSFWMLKEIALNLLKFAIVLELMVRVFGHFPTAYVSVRRAVAAVVAILGVLVASALRQGTGHLSLVGTVMPVVTDATVWLFVALGAYCLWYHLPLDAVHKAILVGLVPYMLIFSVVLRAIGRLGVERADAFNAAAPHAYLCVLAYWAVVAWRRGSEDDAGTRVARLVGHARGVDA